MVEGLDDRVFFYFQEMKVTSQKWVWDLAFSSDSNYLFTASSDGIGRVWYLLDGNVKRKYIGHAKDKAITCLAFRDGESDP